MEANIPCPSGTSSMNSNSGERQEDGNSEDIRARLANIDIEDPGDGDEEENHELVLESVADPDSVIPANRTYIQEKPQGYFSLCMFSRNGQTDCIGILAAYPHLAREENAEIACREIFDFPHWPVQLLVIGVVAAKDTILNFKEVARTVSFKVLRAPGGDSHTVPSDMQRIFAGWQKGGLAGIVELPSHNLLIFPHPIYTDRPTGILIPKIPLTGGSEVPRAVHLCSVCSSRGSTHAIVPCGHLCLCPDHASILEDNAESTKGCPICNGPIDSPSAISCKSL